ncbi:hypothetical protein BH10ACT10_BH10ACT10_10680 [soil metagenome]
MNHDPVDPEQFVGEPPAGDANPGGFVSNDQSADQTVEPVVPAAPDTSEESA